jgi:hypothetical protein
MADTYTIGKNAVRDHLSSLIKVERLGCKKNIESILDILFVLPEEVITSLVSISLIKTEHTLIKINDTVKFKPNMYSVPYDKDIMIDKGLMTEDGYVYGIVLDDTGWSSEFNPYSENMKVNIFIWKNDKVDKFEVTSTSCNLIIIDESKLPKFNTKEQLEFFNAESTE